MSKRVFNWLQKLSAVAVLLICGTGQPALTRSGLVDVSLVLAIDCSFSVDRREYLLQMEGLGQALQSPEVLEAIKGGPQQKIALSVFLWSDIDSQAVVVPWTVITNENDAALLGRQLITQRRLLAEGGTATSAAMQFAAAQFAIAPPADRKVIDLSTDGQSNMGLKTQLVRDVLVLSGITINGLAVTNEDTSLEKYMERFIAGGAGAFVVSTPTYESFGEVMERKLIKEILGPGTT